MITKRDLVIGILAGFIGSVVGVSANTASVAEEVAKGEVLSVCINTKTGVIKAATKCSKGERKTVLGGVGPQGIQGEKGEKGDVGPVGPQGPQGERGATGIQGERGLTGATGPQGERGFTGATGATGSLVGLRRTNITFLTSDWGCPGWASSVTYVSSVRYNSFSTYTPLDVRTGTLRGCSTDVYVP
jgi:hypothetical protein